MTYEFEIKSLISAAQDQRIKFERATIMLRQQ